MDLVLNKAKKYYSNIVLPLNKLGEIVLNVDSKYSLEVAHKQFDLILQTIMLNQVIADGNFEDKEKEFIENIVEEADLMDFYNVCSDKTFTFESLCWDSLQKFNKKSLKIVIDSVNKIMEPIEDELTYFLALTDSKTKENEFGMFIENLAYLLTCLNVIDEEITDEEKIATVANLMKHFVKRYQYYLVSFEKGASK